MVSGALMEFVPRDDLGAPGGGGRAPRCRRLPPRGSGDGIDVVGRLADALTRTARRPATDPDAFLPERRLFGDPAHVPRCVAAHRCTLHSLHERGARATLEALAGPLHTTTNHSR